MARLLATPRLAAMMVAAETTAQKALAADLAAVLEERDPLARKADAPADILLRLEALAGKIEGDRGALSRIRQAAKIYRNRLGLTGTVVAAGEAGALLAAAFPDRVGQSRGEPGSYRLSGGGSGKLGPADPLARNKLIVVAALQAKGSRVRLGAALDAENLPEILRRRCKQSRESGFDPATGSVLTRERLRLGALVLSDRFSAPAPAEVQSALAQALATRLDQLDWSEAVNLQARVALMREIDPDYPDFSRPVLAATTALWLAPYLAGFGNLKAAKTLDLAAILRAQMSHAQALKLDRMLPSRLALPGGTAVVDYTGPVPVAAAPARNFFGLDATPHLAGGKIALQLALLSPAGRPIAITADLKNFWRHGWLDARRDMRGRYPKHVWPENPWAAPE